MNNLEKKVYQACIDANIEQFTRIISNITDPKQKEQVEKMFNNHMKEITEFIINSQFWKTWKLNEEFIKKLHKISYPPGYKETKKDKYGNDVVFMIPWEYKLFNNFPRVDKNIVSFEIKKLINKYNKGIKKASDKFNFIWEIILDFFKIHPFWHWNWMMASLLLDILLLRNNLESIWLKKHYLNPEIKQQIYNSIEKAIITKNYNIFIENIKKIKN